MKIAFLFLLFVKTCRKYRFTYVISTYDSFDMILRPNRTFENIRISVNPGDYEGLFKTAIQKMRGYAGGAL